MIHRVIQGTERLKRPETRDQGRENFCAPGWGEKASQSVPSRAGEQKETKETKKRGQKLFPRRWGLARDSAFLKASQSVPRREDVRTGR